MTKKTRTENTKLNILIGIAAQFTVLVLSFVSRRLFVNYLSIEYLGINGLYTNVLSMLSLAELGLGCVVSFSLYKPVAEGDQVLIRTLVWYFKWLYRIIAIVVSAAGIALIPFLKYIVTSGLSESALIIYYMLFLLSAVSTYLVAHDVALLSANQENRVQKLVSLAVTLLEQLLHIVILVVFPNYLIYVISSVLCAVLSNMVLNRVTNRKYPYLMAISNEQSEFDRMAIRRNVKSAAVYKLSLVLINSTDNILISVLVSTAAVGIYSNYVVIVTALQTFMTIVTSALISGVGNLNVEANRTRMFDVFNLLVFVYHFAACFCAISLYFISNDFITLWLDGAYTMNSRLVFAVAFNFYLTNLLTPLWIFREATGLFVKAKNITLAAALLNVVLSVLFGLRYGVFGILIATSLSKLCTMVWYEPRILFGSVFLVPQKHYWMKQLKYLLSSVGSVALCCLIAANMSCSIVTVLLRGIIFLLVCGAMFVLSGLKSPELGLLKRIIVRSLKSAH